LWWAQQQLGWFGYFFTWEPFATAPVLPWLAVTALVCALASGADRAAAPVWTGAIVAFAALLAAFGVYRIRTGIEDSVRAVSATPPTPVLVMGGAALLLALVIGLVAWRKRPRRVPRTLGASCTVAGALLAALGFAASFRVREATLTIDTGSAASARDPFGSTWQFTSQGLSSYEETDHTVFALVVSAARDGQRVGLLTTRQRQYFDAQSNDLYDPSTTVGAALTWREAASVALLGTLDRSTAAVRVTFVPLVSCLYAGVLLLLAGLGLAAWPHTSRTPR
jgi:cytochrome c biogenesis factor